MTSVVVIVITSAIAIAITVAIVKERRGLDGPTCIGKASLDDSARAADFTAVGVLPEALTALDMVKTSSECAAQLASGCHLVSSIIGMVHALCGVTGTQLWKL